MLKTQNVAATLHSASLLFLLGFTSLLASAQASTLDSDHPALMQILQKWQGTASQSLENNWQTSQAQLMQYAQQPWLEPPSLKLAHENQAISGNLDNQLWEVGVAFKLKPSAQQNALQQLASTYQTLPAGHHQLLKWQASGKLRILIAQLQHSQTKAKAEKNNVKQLQKLTHQIQRAVELGARSQLDLVQAQAALQQQKILAKQAQTQYATAQQTFGYWLNQTPASTSMDSSDPTANSLFQVERLQPPKNLAEHPKLQWLEAQLTLQTGQAQLAKTQTKDAIEWTLAVQHESMDGIDAQTLVAQASIPLFKDNTAQKHYLETQTTKAKLQLEQQQLQVQLQAQIRHAKAKLAELQAQQQSLQTSLTLQQQQLELTQQAFDLGEIALQPLLLAQQSARQTRQALQLLKVDIHAAIAQLNQAYGYLYQSS